MRDTKATATSTTNVIKRVRAYKGTLSSSAKTQTASTKRIRLTKRSTSRQTIRRVAFSFSIPQRHLPSLPSKSWLRLNLLSSFSSRFWSYARIFFFISRTAASFWSFSSSLTSSTSLLLSELSEESELSSFYLFYFSALAFSPFLLLFYYSISDEWSDKTELTVWLGVSTSLGVFFCLSS